MAGQPPITTNLTDSGDIIGTPGAGANLHIHGGSLHNADSSTVEIDINDGTTSYWHGLLAADGGGSLFNFRGLDGRGVRLPANTALIATFTAAGNVDFNVTYAIGI